MKGRLSALPFLRRPFTPELSHWENRPMITLLFSALRAMYERDDDSSDDYELDNLAGWAVSTTDWQ